MGKNLPPNSVNNGSSEKTSFRFVYLDMSVEKEKLGDNNKVEDTNEELKEHGFRWFRDFLKKIIWPVIIGLTVLLRKYIKDFAGT